MLQVGNLSLDTAWSILWDTVKLSFIFATNQMATDFCRYLHFRLMYVWNGPGKCQTDGGSFWPNMEDVPIIALLDKSPS